MNSSNIISKKTIPLLSKPFHSYEMGQDPVGWAYIILNFTLFGGWIEYSVYQFFYSEDIKWENICLLFALYLLSYAFWEARDRDLDAPLIKKLAWIPVALIVAILLSRGSIVGLFLQVFG